LLLGSSIFFATSCTYLPAAARAQPRPGPRSARPAAGCSSGCGQPRLQRLPGCMAAAGVCGRAAAGRTGYIHPLHRLHPSPAQQGPSMSSNATPPWPNVPMQQTWLTSSMQGRAGRQADATPQLSPAGCPTPIWQFPPGRRRRRPRRATRTFEPWCSCSCSLGQKFCPRQPAQASLLVNCSWCTGVHSASPFGHEPSAWQPSSPYRRLYCFLAAFYLLTGRLDRRQQPWSSLG
jgi:hypothetical protein